MSKALRSYNIQANLPVGERLSDSQVKNNTGGYVYQVSDKSRLERFLILGVDGGTYYVSEKDITQQNVEWLKGLISHDSKLVLDTVLDVSTNGRAYRNSAAIFVLAMLLNYANPNVKTLAADLAPQIARTGTMVFELAQYIENLGGWGRAKRTAVANWFTSKTPDQLAYQAVKYRQRNGWELRDLMRLSHPRGVDPMVGEFILRKDAPMPQYVVHDVEILNGFKDLQSATRLPQVIEILQENRSLPWETIPTQFLKESTVWKQLFYNGQLKGQALVRNIVRLEKLNAFSDGTFRNDVAAALADPELINKSKIHPMQYLNASIVYSNGQVDRQGFGGRNKNWVSKQTITDALQSGFYNSFQNVTPSGKRFLIGLDVSGSMGWTNTIGSDLTCAQAGAAMAMITSRVETDTIVRGFANTFRDLKIHPGLSFSEIMDRVENNNYGGTDMSLPMKFAQQNNLWIDTFVVITDSEVNTGHHPKSQLDEYRRKFNPDAKMVVMGTAVTDFTIADPSDCGMLDVVGFDSQAPKVVSDFAKGF